MAGRRQRATIELLGHRGTVRVLDDLLDQTRLVRLANAVGIRYPGLRNRSQKRPVLLADLAQKALAEREARTAVLKSLDKQVAVARRGWKKLDEDARRQALEKLDPETGGRDFGTHLYLLADESNGTDGVLAGWLEGPLSPRDEDDAQWRDTLEKTRRELKREARRRDETERKVERLEGQLKRHRDVERDLKRKLREATTALTAERKRNRSLETRAAQATASTGGSAEELEKLQRSIRQLGTQHRKWTHELERLQSLLPDEAAQRDGIEVREILESLRKERAALRREKTRMERDDADRLDALRREVQALKRKVLPAPPPEPRPADERERVGVFIDVQNVYYGARQLKGKLDFEALLEAARLDRRLVRSTAYVVESKERDQTAFLKLLGKLDIDVRKKTVKVRADGSMKGDWDMEIALDMLDAAGKLDVAVLVSGDGDFTSLLHRLRAGGTRVELIGFPRTTAKALIEAADRYTPLDRRFMIRGTPKRPPAS